MGWGRMLLLGNFGQQLDIEDQREELRRLRTMASTRSHRGAAARRREEALRAELDETRLYLAAVVRLMARKGVLARGEIEEMVAAIDAEDGTADGRVAGPIA